MIPSTALWAYRDPRLKRRDLRVYANALERLSYYQPRLYKVRVVARESGLHYGHAAASIRRLVACGYLERGPDDGARHTYLLRTELPTDNLPRRAA